MVVIVVAFIVGVIVGHKFLDKVFCICKKGCKVSK